MLRRFKNLIELSCCKLKKIYMLCENFIYTEQARILGLAGLVSRWAHLAPPGSVFAHPQSVLYTGSA